MGDFPEETELSNLQTDMEPPQPSDQTPSGQTFSRRFRRFFEEIYYYADYYFERYFRIFATIFLVLVSFYLWYQFMIIHDKPRHLKRNGTIELSSGTGGFKLWMYSSLILIIVSFFISCV